MFHAENRKRFIERVQGALVVAAGYDQMQLSGDMPAPFLQEANFWWLTGIEYPGWKVIIDGSRGRTTLVRPALSQVQQTFEGDMTDEQAIHVSGATAIISEAELERELKQLARTHTRVRTVVNTVDGEFHGNPAQHTNKIRLERIFASVEACNKELAELRAIKQPAEIERIKQAIKITTHAFQAIHNQWAQYPAEYVVEADFTRAFRSDNATHAYAPIVAGGPRACTLHYGANEHKIAARDAVVIDIGARYKGYAADITRTYCETPSKRTQAVHQAVVRAQRDIIALLRPNLLVGEYVAAADDIMRQALGTLGLLDSPADTARFRRYFPHAVSHGLGVDVHDSLGAPRVFVPGMVLTVEPGIYIPEESIGVRIEDDILITDTGFKNLSSALSTDL